MSDMRLYETFYGIDVDHWDVTWGGLNNHHKILVKEYISDGCHTEESSSATEEHKFLYPQALAKKYFIEGVISGHVTFAASGGTSYLCSFRVAVVKLSSSAVTEELFTTGWLDVNEELAWDDGYEIGDEIVCPFWIDAMDYAELGDEDRFYVSVESSCSCYDESGDCLGSCCTDVLLYHSNDTTWEDLKITIPFLGI